MSSKSTTQRDFCALSNPCVFFPATSPGTLLHVDSEPPKQSVLGLSPTSWQLELVPTVTDPPKIQPFFSGKWMNMKGWWKIVILTHFCLASSG